MLLLCMNNFLKREDLFVECLLCNVYGRGYADDVEKMIYLDWIYLDCEAFENGYLAREDDVVEGAVFFGAIGCRRGRRGVWSWVGTVVVRQNCFCKETILLKWPLTPCYLSSRSRSINSQAN